jgi:hypothetical protein
MSLFTRRPKLKPLDLSKPVDDSIARQVADLVNKGKHRQANRLCEKTDNPRGTAFQAFRYINVED